MNSLVRISILAVTICLCVAVKTDRFIPSVAWQTSLVSSPPFFVAEIGKISESTPNTNPSSIDNLIPADPGYNGEQDSTFVSSTAYETIAKRNVFGLTPVTAANTPTFTIVGPKQDLVLTGLVGVGDIRYAMFQIIEPGKLPSCFMLQEGEQNKWLEVRAINVKSGRVIAFLKQPVMRIHNAGVEVILTLDANGLTGCGGTRNPDEMRTSERHGFSRLMTTRR